MLYLVTLSCYTVNSSFHSIAVHKTNCPSQLYINSVQFRFSPFIPTALILLPYSHSRLPSIVSCSFSRMTFCLTSCLFPVTQMRMNVKTARSVGGRRATTHWGASAVQQKKGPKLKHLWLLEEPPSLGQRWWGRGQLLPCSNVEEGLTPKRQGLRFCRVEGAGGCGWGGGVRNSLIPKDDSTYHRYTIAHVFVFFCFKTTGWSCPCVMILRWRTYCPDKQLQLCAKKCSSECEGWGVGDCAEGRGGKNCSMLYMICGIGHQFERALEL
jgi:hypothetical protein